MEETLRDVLNIVTPLFAVFTMLSMGLSMRVKQILRPLQNLRLVALALFANFVVVPATAILLAEVFALDEDIRIGLVLISVAAGAPLVPKLAQIARANVPAAVGLVALMVLVTIVYIPVVLPLVLPDVDVDALGIAVTLLLQLLLPLALGLTVKGLFDEMARMLLPPVALAGNALFASLLLLTFGLNIGDVLGLFGSGGLISILLLITVAAVTGYALGGPRPGRRRALTLATAQRGLAAAFIIGIGNFADRHEVLAMLASAALLGMVTVIPLAVVFGRLSQTRDLEAQARREERDAGTEEIERLLSEADRRRDQDTGGERRPGYRRR